MMIVLIIFNDLTRGIVVNGRWLSIVDTKKGIFSVYDLFDSGKAIRQSPLEDGITSLIACGHNRVYYTVGDSLFKWSRDSFKMQDKHKFEGGDVRIIDILCDESPENIRLVIAIDHQVCLFDEAHKIIVRLENILDKKYTECVGSDSADLVYTVAEYETCKGCRVYEDDLDYKLKLILLHNKNDGTEVEDLSVFYEENWDCGFKGYEDSSEHMKWPIIFCDPLYSLTEFRGSTCLISYHAAHNLLVISDLLTGLVRGMIDLDGIDLQELVCVKLSERKADEDDESDVMMSLFFRDRAEVYSVGSSILWNQVVLEELNSAVKSRKGIDYKELDRHLFARARIGEPALKIVL